MNEKFTNECTHNCHTCGSACNSETGKEGFFDKIEKISNQLDEDEVLKVLNDTVSEWSKELDEDDSETKAE